MGIIESLLMAASLCTDCFAVSMCSSVSAGKLGKSKILKISLSFAFIQTALLMAGWVFGNAIADFVNNIAHIIGFLLLLYVGGNMLVEGIKDKQQGISLGNIQNVIIGGIATSIDALAVGAAKSIDGSLWSDFVPLLVSVFAITVLSVAVGIIGGNRIGRKFGRIAEIAGGIVLIVIGITILI